MRCSSFLGLSGNAVRATTPRFGVLLEVPQVPQHGAPSPGITEPLNLEMHAFSPLLSTSPLLSSVQASGQGVLQTNALTTHQPNIDTEITEEGGGLTARNLRMCNTKNAEKTRRRGDGITMYSANKHEKRQLPHGTERERPLRLRPRPDRRWRPLGPPGVVDVPVSWSVPKKKVRVRVGRVAPGAHEPAFGRRRGRRGSQQRKVPTGRNRRVRPPIQIHVG